MNVGDPLLVRVDYLGSGQPERIGGAKVATVLVRVPGLKRPMRVPVSSVEPADRSHIRITEVDYAIDRPLFAKKLRKLRQSRNISQGNLARLLDISQSAVSQWENGEVAPRLDRIVVLASVLGVSVSEMLEGSE